MDQPQVVTERHGELLLVRINRSGSRNAVDGPTAALLAAAFREFEADEGLRVAILTGKERISVPARTSRRSRKESMPIEFPRKATVPWARRGCGSASP